MVGNFAAGYPDVRGLMNKTKYIIGGIKMKKKDIFEQFLQDSCDCRHITAAAANSLRKVGGPTLLEDRILMVDDTSSSMSSTILSSSEWDLLQSLA